MLLHCPWCGNELARQEGELFCQDGQMGLSAHLEKRLREVFVDQSRPSRASPHDNMDQWHCAGCGILLVRDAEGKARCPKCSHTMGEFAYELVEFHPHARRR